MTKKIVFLFSFITVLSSLIFSQSLTQIAYIVKKAIPDSENYVVLFPKDQEEVIKKHANTASLINKKKFHIYPIINRPDITKVLPSIMKIVKPTIIIITNENILNAKSIKFIAQKVGLKGIPVVTNRENDTTQGALLSILDKDNKIETHVNIVMASILKITFPQDFLDEAIIDVQ